ncbi:MAG TPA: type II secretion system minor pseudopilin GspI [Thermodesulfobacteriota bacterium]
MPRSRRPGRRAAARLPSERGRPVSGRGPAAGFTLLEVLVALVILGVALVGLLSAQSAAVRLRSQAEELTLATFLLETKMTDVQMGDFPEVGTTEGDFGDDYPGYTWQQVVSDTPFRGVREVRIAVIWSPGPRPERLELVHFMVERRGGS